MSISIALFQPDIPGNTGTILRLGACLGIKIHIIEPAGFDLSDRNLKRAGMDYLDRVLLQRHVNWEAFNLFIHQTRQRIVLFTTKAKTAYCAFAFQTNDILLFGRESAGVPDYVRQQLDNHVTIKMQEGARSLNLALSVAMGAGEALRQTNRFS